MARLVGSTVEPETLQPDIVQDGRVRLLVHWDAVQKEITDDMGTRTEWEYQEQVLWVPLPGSEYIEPGEYRPSSPQRVSPTSPRTRRRSWPGRRQA